MQRALLSSPELAGGLPAVSNAQGIQPLSQSILSRDEKLKELKRLNDSGLISESIYLERQKAILDK